LSIKRLRVIVIGNLEFLADTRNSSSSSSSDFGLNVF
jgi:hypothetical protein